jgi:hypothetical protein
MVEGPEDGIKTLQTTSKDKEGQHWNRGKLKLVQIGDYWDDETIEKIVELLHEYQDLFLSNFSEMKGIVGELGEMRIQLNPDAKHKNATEVHQ